MMGKVILNDIRVYAFHGCMEEERRIGSDYIVNMEGDRYAKARRMLTCLKMQWIMSYSMRL